MISRPPTVRRSIAVVVLTAGVMVALWIANLPLEPNIVVGIAVAAVGVLWIAFGSLESIGEWPPVPARSFEGARRETAQLAWALRTRSGEINPDIIARVHTLATVRLAAHGLDPANPRDGETILALAGPLVAAVAGAEDGWPTELGGLGRTLDAIRVIPAARGHRPIAAHETQTTHTKTGNTESRRQQ